MSQELHFRAIGPEHSDRIIELVSLLNSSVPRDVLRRRLGKQWGFQGYYLFGLFRGERLIGVASVWISLRLYGGTLAELDNVIVDPEERGGTGKVFLDHLIAFCRAEGCRRVELKSYTGNRRSHKFYLNNGFEIYAFYFVNQIHGGDGEG